MVAALSYNNVRKLGSLAILLGIMAISYYFVDYAFYVNINDIKAI